MWDNDGVSNTLSPTHLDVYIYMMGGALRKNAVLGLLRARGLVLQMSKAMRSPKSLSTGAGIKPGTQSPWGFAKISP